MNFASMIVLVIASICTTTAQPTTQQIKKNADAIVKTDPQKFLQYCLDYYNRTVQDFTCIFIKKELLGGKMSKTQKMSVKFRDKPFSVFVKWELNPIVASKILYIKGQNDNKMLVQPSGWAGLLVWGHVVRPINSPDTYKTSQKTIDQFGFKNILMMVIKTNKMATKHGDINIKYVGDSKIGNSKTYVIERIISKNSKQTVAKLILHIDKKNLLPIAVYCYDRSQKLTAKYISLDVKINVGLTDKHFTPKNNGM